MTARAIRLLATLLMVVIGTLLPGIATAQRADAMAVPAFSGTLQKIVDAKGLVRIGYRQNSPPFAFLDKGGRPIGYSLDLCNVVLEEIGRELHRELRVELVPVTPENRFDLVESGQVDLECGSSTRTTERSTRVAFSPTIFVTGTKLLVKRGSPVQSLRDLAGKTVVLTSGTVHAEMIPKLAERQKLGITFVNGRDHNESLEMLAAGKADAFANDDIQLYGMVATTNTASQYRVTGDFLSYADYALVMRRDDPEFAAVVQRAFDRLAGGGEIVAIYRNWFQRPLPSGVRLNVPMSAHLAHSFRLQGVNSD